MEDSEPLEILKDQINLPEREIQNIFYANSDRLIHEIENETGVSISGRDAFLILRGTEYEIRLGKRIIENLIYLIKEKGKVSRKDLLLIIGKVKNNIHFNIGELQKRQISIGNNGKVITPKSINQASYFDAIRQNDINFAIGPAGTGKTYIAMAFALHYLFAENISRIILTRPVVEAGESLGYLPGDMEQKVTPYLRPLYDAIYDMIPYSVFQKYIEKGAIEIAPLAYMRGRTLHDAFIILDEAQNTTKGQILMFLTRIGFNSKAIVTGDITQIDLPPFKDSGLIVASRILQGIRGISFTYFGPEDVVRHPLVEEIIKAFDREKEEKEQKKEKK